MKVPIVTIVGRPNVGKSTLFNKMAGARIAITAREEGTTRDRLFYKVETPEMDYFLVDTGGLEFGKGDTTIEDDMQSQARVAIEEADLILFLISAKEGTIGEDIKVAEILRKRTNNKPVFLVVNKCDNPLDEASLAPLYSLGLGEPHQVSALNKTGVDMLGDQVIGKLKEQHFLTKDNETYKAQIKWEEKYADIALVGRPNAGKSSIINALLNKNKLIVSEIPGTTRDSTDHVIQHDQKGYNFIDTAGLKRKSRIKPGLERFSTLRSIESIERSDVAVLVIDSSEPITHQDQHIANAILDAKKGLIVLMNKWDIKTEEDEEKEEKRKARYLKQLQRRFTFLSWAPIIFTSAVTKQNLSKIFDQIDMILKERKVRITTPKLNRFLQELIANHRPTGTKRTNPKIYYITQPEIEPPHFVLFVNRKEAFHFSYLRYVENKLREKFGFVGTPILISYREKPKQY